VTTSAQEVDYDALDPGIRRTVALLRSAGFRTCDSGDGVTKLAANPDDECALDVASVRAVVDRSDAFWEVDRLLDVVSQATGQSVEMLAEVSGVSVEMTYSPLDETCLLAVYVVDDSMLGVG
jgi:hypothetical protein